MTRSSLMSSSFSTLLVASLSFAACGLDRPVEQQPLVSVVEQWRQDVLESVTVGFLPTGDPVDVSAAGIGGDFGAIGWDGRLDAEGTGTVGDDMASVSLLAGGGQQPWGMAILGFVMPPRALLVPGVWTELDPGHANVVGCTGQVLFNWTSDESAWDTAVVATLDAKDPTLAHFEFQGDFADGSSLEGAFTMRLPAPAEAP